MDKLPITVRRSIELLGILGLAAIIMNGMNILMPLLMAFFISILLLPLYRLLKKWRIPEVIAIVLSILTAALIVAGVAFFFSIQIARLINDFPALQRNVNAHWHNLSDWINQKTHFSTKEQLRIINEQTNSLLNNAGMYLRGAAVSLTSVFVFVGLLPIYIFLMLYYKNLLLRFVFLWFKSGSHEEVESALREIQVIIKSYLSGLMIQVTYMTILVGGTLMLLGNKHAILIGLIFAILNLIPYIGALIGNLIGILLTLTSSQDPFAVLTVLIVIAVAQFLDNNILMPRIVGSKVKLNALASIVGVIIGGTLAGISGMFLSLPVMAILKVIFDRTETMRPWGVLLGDENPKRSPMNVIPLRFRKKNQPPQEDTREAGGSKPPLGSGS
jgi:predicted PurR-regulated permease PerM